MIYEEFENGHIVKGDCLELMKEVESKSVDMILCDLPYGTTACKWDTIIPFEPLWEQYKRIIKDGGAIVLTASQPFTSALVMSNVEMFKHRWCWDKVKPGSGLLAKKAPLRNIEDVIVFCKGTPQYNPQMYNKKHRIEKKNDRNGEAFGNARTERLHDNKGQGYPKELLSISNADQNNRIHPTQKPVALFEYLIKTYTNEGELVLDNCSGSGTTAIAAINTNRNFLCMEMDKTYYNKSVERVKNHVKPNINEVAPTFLYGTVPVESLGDELS